MPDKPITTQSKRIPVAVSAEQAEIIHSLEKAISDGFVGTMGLEQLRSARADLKRIWEMFAENRIALGLSKGMKA